MLKKTRRRKTRRRKTRGKGNSRGLTAMELAELERTEEIGRGKVRAATPGEKKIRINKAFWYQIHLLPFLLEPASPRAVSPSLLACLLCVDHLPQFLSDILIVLAGS